MPPTRPTLRHLSALCYAAALRHDAGHPTSHDHDALDVHVMPALCHLLSVARSLSPALHYAMPPAPTLRCCPSHATSPLPGPMHTSTTCSPLPPIPYATRCAVMVSTPLLTLRPSTPPPALIHAAPRAHPCPVHLRPALRSMPPLRPLAPLPCSLTPPLCPSPLCPSTHLTACTALNAILLITILLIHVPAKEKHNDHHQSHPCSL
jgi:hypothetical protein